jgi:hypothetical protein
MKITNIVEAAISDDMWLQRVKDDPVRFNSIKSPSEKIQIAAVHAMAELQGSSWLPAWMCEKLTSEDAQKVAMSYDDKAIYYFPIQYSKNIINALWMHEDLNTLLQMVEIPKALYNDILTSPYIIKQKSRYDKIVKILLKGNELLINKWIRYGDNIRV